MPFLRLFSVDHVALQLINISKSSKYIKDCLLQFLVAVDEILYNRGLAKPNVLSTNGIVWYLPHLAYPVLNC